MVQPLHRAFDAVFAYTNRTEQGADMSGTPRRLEFSVKELPSTHAATSAPLDLLRPGHEYTNCPQHATGLHFCVLREHTYQSGAPASVQFYVCRMPPGEVYSMSLLFVYSAEIYSPLPETHSSLEDAINAGKAQSSLAWTFMHTPVIRGFALPGLSAGTWQAPQYDILNRLTDCSEMSVLDRLNVIDSISASDDGSICSYIPPPWVSMCAANWADTTCFIAHLSRYMPPLSAELMINGRRRLSTARACYEYMLDALRARPWKLFAEGLIDSAAARRAEEDFAASSPTRLPTCISAHALAAVTASTRKALGNVGHLPFTTNAEVCAPLFAIDYLRTSDHLCAGTVRPTVHELAETWLGRYFNWMATTRTCHTAPSSISLIDCVAELAVRDLLFVETPVPAAAGLHSQLDDLLELSAVHLGPFDADVTPLKLQQQLRDRGPDVLPLVVLTDLQFWTPQTLWYTLASLLYCPLAGSHMLDPLPQDVTSGPLPPYARFAATGSSTPFKLLVTYCTLAEDCGALRLLDPKLCFPAHTYVYRGGLPSLLMPERFCTRYMARFFTAALAQYVVAQATQTPTTWTEVTSPTLVQYLCSPLYHCAQPHAPVRALPDSACPIAFSVGPEHLDSDIVSLQSYASYPALLQLKLHNLLRLDPSTSKRNVAIVAVDAESITVAKLCALICCCTRIVLQFPIRNDTSPEQDDAQLNSSGLDGL